MARACMECGTAVPWGAPQCVSCGAYTHWRSRLATLGITIGGGTVLVVVASLLRVYLVAPPDRVQAGAEVQEFLERVADSEDRSLIAGAGRCKQSVAEALCVQTTPDFTSLAAEQRAAARARWTEAWRSIAVTNPEALVLVDPTGQVAQDF